MADPSALSDDDLLEALRRWAPDSGIAGLKDLHLRHVVKSGKRTAAELATGMPPVVSRNAAAIAAIMRTAMGSTESASASQPAEAHPTPQTPGESVRPTLRRLSDPSVAAPATEAAPPTSIAPDVEVRAAPAADAVDAEGFVPWDFLSAAGEPGACQVSVRPDGSQVVTWQPAIERAVYRLVAGDRDQPYSPDDARVVLATWGTRAIDVEPFADAVRHFQVWRNEGSSEAVAKQAQPVLHAVGTIIAPVSAARVAEDSGRVVGHWDALPGTTAVRVFRVPRAQAAGGSFAAFRILAEQRLLSGFVDPGAERGARYVYMVRAEATTDGGDALLANPQPFPVDVSAQLDAVRDLRVTVRVQDERDLSVDLGWTTPPGGRVVIYRTAQPPQPGVDRQPISAAVLEEQARLAVVDRLNQPFESDGGRSVMRSVPWPAGWARVHLTPVVLLGDLAFVGTTAGAAHLNAPAEVRIVERVRRQLLTFDWPVGATSVQVFRSQSGADPALALQGEPFEVTADDYRERGGFEPGADPLPRDGCDLHLVSVLFDGGEPVRSQPLTVHYPGIRRLRYTCTVKRNLLGRSSALVSIESPEVRIDAAPPFVLVYNRDRLPLNATDGAALAMVLDGDEGERPVVQIRPRFLDRAGAGGAVWRSDPDSWKQLVGARGGYLRLFVDIPTDRARFVALIDPPLDSLQVKPGGR